MIPGVAFRRQFKNLSEQEVLALAISSEEDDGRIYRWYAQLLAAGFPQSAKVFEEMAGEEDDHRAALTEEHRRRFGETIPLIRREHVAGFYHRRPVWLIQNLGAERIREEASRMEVEARDFYQRAAQRTSDAGTRQLLNRLAAAESGHETTWQGLLSRASAAGRPRGGERGGGPPVRADLGAAGARRLDGRLGLDARADLRRGLRHRRYLEDLPGRPGGVGRRRHLDGLHRSRVGRRLDLRVAARRSSAAWPRV